MLAPAHQPGQRQHTWVCTRRRCASLRSHRLTGHSQLPPARNIGVDTDLDAITPGWGSEPDTYVTTRKGEFLGTSVTDAGRGNERFISSITAFVETTDD